MTRRMKSRLTVQKRDGRKAKFDKDKIKIAVLKAFIDVDGEETTYAKEKARDIANYIESLEKDMSVEEIQDEVVNKLMSSSRKDVAAKYVEYRYKRKLVRESNTTDKRLEPPNVVTPKRLDSFMTKTVITPLPKTP